MNVVGVDLAWSSTGDGRTGLCIVREGRAVDSGVVRTDDEIVGWLAGRLDAEPWLFAVDAPLIVRNESGQRPCERLVSSLFARYHAGAHSSNTRRPSFGDGTRGQRLAWRLDAEIATGGSPVTGRAMIEVYPHPALVTLFGLDRRLEYKARPGRALHTRRSELRRLHALLDSLRAAEPALDVARAKRWPRLGDELEEARSGAALDRVEDELDAYVCAYVGLYHAVHGPPRSHVFGNLQDGFIVVPLAAAFDPAVPHEVARRAADLLSAPRAAGSRGPENRPA